MCAQKVEAKKKFKKFSKNKKFSKFSSKDSAGTDAEKSSVPSNKVELGPKELEMLEGLRKGQDAESKAKLGRITLSELFGVDSKTANGMNALGNQFYLDPMQLIQMQLLLNQSKNLANMGLNNMFLNDMPLPSGRLTPSGVGMMDPEYENKLAKAQQKARKMAGNSFGGMGDSGFNPKFFGKALVGDHFMNSAERNYFKDMEMYGGKKHSMSSEYNRNSFNTSKSSSNSPFSSRGMSGRFYPNKFNNSGQQHFNPMLSRSPNGLKLSPKKSFFMPYFTSEQVNRGLKNDTLVVGTIRVNPKNYEESQIDQPEGDDQLDILVLGLHDRNRALHGDTVVVRYKERIHWVIRENLYQSWREGKLNNSFDENGLPIAIPPVTEWSEPKTAADDILDYLPGQFRTRINDLDTSVSMKTETQEYSREEMLRVAMGMEMNTNKEPILLFDNTTKPCGMEHESCMSIRKMAINRYEHNDGMDLDFPHSPISKKKTTKVPVASVRRATHRILAEMPSEDWGMPDICLQRTAEVVFIKENRHTRMAVGQLKPLSDGNKNYALFSPYDPRMPRMMIPSDQIPDKFMENPMDFSKFIFVARLVEWADKSQFARGKLYRPIGLSTEIDSQVNGILMSNGVEFKEFSPSAMACIPATDNDDCFEVDPKDLESRRDYRELNTFSIDPRNSKYLDDVIHAKKIENIDGNGNNGYEFGIHVSDVTHFLEGRSELDDWAQRRGETVYLAEKAVPMLPPKFTENICGLSKGKDRLAISVVWKMLDNGKIIGEWIGKSVVRSSAELSYDDVSKLLECGKKDIPVDADLKTLVDDLYLLVEVYKKLYQQRKADGFLTLPKPKVNFEIMEQPVTTPTNVLIEHQGFGKKIMLELSVKANVAVAKRLEKEFPKLALLRKNGLPKQKALMDVVDMLNKLDVEVDISSVKSIGAGLDYLSVSPTTRYTAYPAVCHLIGKALQKSQYVCSGLTTDEKELRNFALNSDLYTHFTAPLRRYVDILTHRLLNVSLGVSKLPDLTAKHVEIICKNSNEKRLSAKTCSDACDELYLGSLIKEYGKIEQIGVVIGIMDQSFEVYFPKLGLTKRVFTNRLRLTQEPTFEGKHVPNMILHWDTQLLCINNTRELETIPEEPDLPKSSAQQIVKMFSPVRCVLSATSEPFKFQTTILPTTEEDIPLMVKELASINVI